LDRGFGALRPGECQTKTSHDSGIADQAGGQVGKLKRLPARQPAKKRKEGKESVKFSAKLNNLIARISDKIM